MERCKLQFGCLAIIFFIIFTYLREVGVDTKNRKYSLFTAIYLSAIIWVIFDGITAYMVNNLDSVNLTLNLACHLMFMISIDTTVFLMFLYILAITEGFPPKFYQWTIIVSPFAINLFFLICSIKDLYFIQGKTTAYSMGIPAYTCYSTVILYFLLTFFTFFRRYKYFERKKAMSIFVFMVVSLLVTVFQMIFPEILITAIAPTIFVLGIYLNQEDPSVKKLEMYNRDTVIDFATLVENRDNNTGGHIKRTTEYVTLLINELRERKLFRNILSKDYIKAVEMAAPMHDIGKIATPDSILQKPGKLTDEEYTIMKQHAEKGASIIKETFGKRSEPQFIEVAFNVAKCHHEKWNGRGYPSGLKEDKIPLEARIMAIADVFDAISQKRCYREAMPLDACFEIIEKGRGEDFDPLLTDIFLEIRPKVEEVYNRI